MRETSLFVHILVALFGIGSWLDINGVWVELPILVEHLPEGWNLGSYLIIIIQVANIGPLLYTVGHLLAPRVVSERPVVFIVLSVGAVACLLLAFLWNWTTKIGGVEHSTPLLFLNFFLGTVDCTSSIVFLTFMSFFKTPYMTSYFIGEGLSGLLPSLVAIGQGVGVMSCKNVSSVNATLLNGTFLNETSYSVQPVYFPPRFPPRDFFLFLFLMMVVSLSSFALLNFLPHCKREQVCNVHEITREGTEDFVSPSLSRNSGVFHTNPPKPQTSVDTAQINSLTYNTFKEPRETKTKTRTLTNISAGQYGFLLVLTAWLNGLGNGALPSLQSYACLPYGNETYHLAVTLAQIANPVACFVAFFLTVTSKYTIAFLTLLSSLVAAYILALASLSPKAVLVGEISGEALAVSDFEC